MQLKSVWYQEHWGQPNQWTLEELQLGNVNLIVGKNASGKTRVLNLLQGLSLLLWNGRQVSHGHYVAKFDHEGAEIVYELLVDQMKIEKEIMTRDDFPLLTRGAGGYGTIWAEKLNEHIDFQTPENQVAAVSRSDAIQHSFLSSLVQWADATYHFAFSEDLGHRHLMVMQPGAPPADLHDTNMVVPAYRKAKRDYPEIDDLIINDMRRLGYNITSIGLAPPQAVQLSIPHSGLELLYVQESDLTHPTEQILMSTGMFRALSVLVQINYGYVSNTHACVLIDDIGEGLDFERAKALIEVVSDKAKTSELQVVMSSNDRFVMNAVPLTDWTVLRRTGSTVTPMNYKNSKKAFDQFRYTGLSNFDFFSRDFLGTAN